MSKPLNVRATREYKGSLTNLGNGWHILYLENPVKGKAPLSFTAPSREECLKQAEKAGFGVEVEDEVPSDRGGDIVGLFKAREQEVHRTMTSFGG